jgi:endonuclease YncB( thermonuclease family)
MNHSISNRAYKFFFGGNKVPPTSSTQSLPDKIDWKDTIPYIPPVTGGRVIKVYDGDTITIATYVHGLPDLYRFSVRLNGIDCPEMKTKNESEKAVAKMAQQRLSDAILGRDIDLREVQLEKYGRLLAEVWCDGVSMNDMLVTERLAVAYDGGTKHTPDNWLDYHMKS